MQGANIQWFGTPRFPSNGSANEQQIPSPSRCDEPYETPIEMIPYEVIYASTTVQNPERKNLLANVPR